MAKFTQASKPKGKANILLAGPSGAGKTLSALLMAVGLANGGKIAVADTEFGRSKHYVGYQSALGTTLAFDHLDLRGRWDDKLKSYEDPSIEQYIDAINSAEEAGYKVLIIDSGSHAWEWLLQEVEEVAKKNYNGNTYRAWAEGTPLQRRFINAFHAYSGFLIMTLRSETAYEVKTDDNGKFKGVTRVGLKPKQRGGFEYEFDMFIEGGADHIFRVSKEATGGVWQDSAIEKPNEAFGQQLRAWFFDGVKPATDRKSGFTAAANQPSEPTAAKPEPEPEPKKEAPKAEKPSARGSNGTDMRAYLELVAAGQVSEADIAKIKERYKVSEPSEMSQDKLDELVKVLNARWEKRKASKQGNGSPVGAAA